MCTNILVYTHTHTSLFIHEYYNQVTMAGLSSPETTEFLSQIPLRNLDPPWYNNRSLVLGWEVSIRAIVFILSLSITARLLMSVITLIANIFLHCRHI